MDVSLRSDLGSAAFVDEWRALWERDPAASLFHRPEYLAAWLPEFGADRHVVGVEVRERGALTGLANCSVDPDGVLRFLGDPAVTDYFGPIGAPEDRDAIAEAFVTAALDVGSWDRAELLGLASDSGWPEAIARAAKAAGLAVEERQQDVCPRVALSGDFDAYLSSLDGKLRHEIRRKARRLEREAGSFTARLAGRAELHDDLERFFEWHRTSQGPKGHFLHWGTAGFFVLLARAFDAAGWLRFSLLEIGGEPVAGVLSFRARATWSVYNSAYDHRYRELAPGMVLMGETIRIATEEGCSTVDLLRGDEPYKYRFGAIDVPLTALTIRRD